VRNVIAHHWGLTGDLTDSSHGSFLKRCSARCRYKRGVHGWNWGKPMIIAQKPGQFNPLLGDPKGGL